MTKQEPESCWEFWHCPKNVKEQCLAYKLDAGNRCWLVSVEFCPRAHQEFSNCMACPWFKKMNPDFGKC
ncbi:hypothetical protein HZB01_05295 [Candidatus Woesearchaeota archaeon]|nr:hypothetical protein [Candidatus Woesearchaeota archaeon]